MLPDPMPPAWGDCPPPSDTDAPSEVDQAAPEDKAKRPKRGPSQADLLVRLAESAEVELFHSAEAKCYATMPMGDHRETWPLRSMRFRQWLAREYYRLHNKAPGSQAIADATNVLTGKATYDGPEQEAHIRVAGDGREVVYLDLCDEKWRAIEITAEGWRLIAQPPVTFRRAAGMLPLPVPVCGGDIRDLRRHLNITDDAWPLLLSWLVATFKPIGPYPVASLLGEQGSAKTTAARMARALVDPNSAGLRAEPRNAHDLAIAAGNSWCVAYDNLSSIRPWLSDALCRLSTGGAFATRELYSDDAEVLFEAMRPVLLTGINEVATRGDLLDRSILINLPRIPEAARKQERELWEAFEADRPRLLGALCDAVSRALARQEEVVLESLPRMADFATWAVSAEPALGLEEGEFMRAYVGNRAAGNELALEASPIWLALQSVLQDGGHVGTATELLSKLEDAADERTRRQRGWPSSPSILGKQLRRLAPNLRAAGCDFESMGGTPRRLVIRLRDCGRNSNSRPYSSEHQGVEP